MKLSDIGSNRQNKKLCELISRTTISCIFEGKCDFEKSKLGDGDILLKSPKTRNQITIELKQITSVLLCRK